MTLYELAHAYREVQVDVTKVAPQVYLVTTYLVGKDITDTLEPLATEVVSAYDAAVMMVHVTFKGTFVALVLPSMSLLSRVSVTLPMRLQEG